MIVENGVSYSLIALYENGIEFVGHRIACCCLMMHLYVDVYYTVREGERDIVKHKKQERIETCSGARPHTLYLS